jgi:hypothetical protein
VKYYKIEQAFAVSKAGDVLAFFLYEQDAVDYAYKMNMRERNKGRRAI